MQESNAYGNKGRFNENVIGFNMFSICIQNFIDKEQFITEYRWCVVRPIDSKMSDISCKRLTTDIWVIRWSWSCINPYFNNRASTVAIKYLCKTEKWINIPLFFLKLQYFIFGDRNIFYLELTPSSANDNNCLIFYAISVLWPHYNLIIYRSWITSYPDNWIVLFIRLQLTLVTIMTLEYSALVCFVRSQKWVQDGTLCSMFSSLIGIS